MKKSNRIVSLLLCVALILTQFVSSVVVSAEETAVTYGGMELEVVNDFTEFELKYGYIPNESSHKFETKANRATHYGQVLQVNGGSTIKYSKAAGAPMSEFYLVQYEDSETLNSSSKIKHSGWHKGNVTLDANTKYIFINIKTTTTSLTEEQIEAIISSFVLYDETTNADKEAKLAEYREKHSAVLNWEFAEDANLPELFTAALEDYAVLGSYERSLLSDEEKANLEKIPHYYNAEDYRTEHKTVLELDLSGEVEEYIDAMIAAINGYDALADLTKSFLTEAEINQIEKMRNDVALPYFVNKFNANHADALALTVETVTDDAEVEEKINAAIAEYASSYPVVKAALADEYSHLKALQHQIVNEIRLGGWNGTDDFSDPEKSSLLWTDGLTDYIKDGKFYIPKKINWGPADYALVDGIIAENDKPVAVNFDINLLNTDYGPRFNLFTGKTAGPIVDFQCAGGKFIFDVDANGWSKKSSTGGTSIFTGVQNVNIDYNWENWAVANEVTVTVTLSQNGATKTLTGVFLFTESETNIKPTVFNLGFAGTNNGKAVYIDNVLVLTDSTISVYVSNFRTEYEDVLLGEAPEEARIFAAVQEYNALPDLILAELTDEEKAKLDSFGVNWFRTVYADALNLDLTNGITDEIIAAKDSIEAAAEAYTALLPSIKALFSADEAAKLDTLVSAVPAIDFKNDYSAVLELSIDTVTADTVDDHRDTITNARTAYDSLSLSVMELLETEKIHIYGLCNKVSVLDGTYRYKSLNVNQDFDEDYYKEVVDIRDLVRMKKVVAGISTSDNEYQATDLANLRLYLLGSYVAWDDDDTLKILTIGNSFSVDSMQYVYQIAEAAGVKNIRLGNLYKASCTIGTHLSMAKANSAYTYYTNNNGTWKTGSSTLSDAVKSEDWDFISFQQASTYSGDESTYDSLNELMEIVKPMCTNTSVEFVWHMTWAYQSDSTHSGFTKYNNDQKTMYDAIVSAVISKIVSNQAITTIIPNGTAIQNARTSYLGDTLTRDGYHLSYNQGRIIAGITMVDSLVGINWDNFDLSSLSSDQAFLEVAYESVKNAVETPFSVTQSAFVE